MKYSIIVKDLVKSYGELLALDGFSMRCRERKIYALLGPNGSGKTTFIKCLFGLLPFTSGELSILGRSVPHELPHVYKKLGYMPQEYSLYEDLTVRENLEFFGNL
ncbi:MAG: ATP-binding cassette domain-containing protein [Candidatus Methanofastidiosia archaeon]